jgi:hypothetical protein
MKKMLLALTVCCFLSSAIVLRASEDQIERCIEKSNPVRLSNLFATKFLLQKADKDNYLALAKTIVEKMQTNLKQALSPLDGIRIVGGTLAAILGSIAFYAGVTDKENVFARDTGMERAIIAAAGVAAAAAGVDQITKGLNKYDRTQQMIKALAVQGLIVASPVTPAK